MINDKLKSRLAETEATIHSVLHPLGFKKKKNSWRRKTNEILQQFTILSEQVGHRYRPEWGLNLLSRSEDPNPVPWRLHVRWLFEEVVRDLDERLMFFDCLKLDSIVPNTVRQEQISKMVSKFIVPCFESFKTENAVKAMIRSDGHPYRAQLFHLLPDSWFPE